MSPDATGRPLALAILGPDPWAERVVGDLTRALPGAKTFTCADPTALPALLGSREIAAVVARVAADTMAASLAAIANRAGLPVVVCAGTDARTETLLEMMGAGAAALVRDANTAGLAAAVRRACPPAATRSPTIAGAERDTALQALADLVEHPLALVADGKLQYLNRAMRTLFGLAADADLRGRPFAELAAPDSAKPLSSLLARALLLELDDKTRETLRFVPPTGPAFAAEVTVAPIDLGSRPELAVQLDPTGARAGIGPPTNTADLPTGGHERAALLRRLGMLAADDSPVERTSSLALVIVADYAAQRRRLGFAGAARLVGGLADCLAAAAPAASTLHLVADETYAVLVDDMVPTEMHRLRQRLVDAPSEAVDAALREIRLSVGVTSVAPGAGTPRELLDRALADAMPARSQTTATPETTEGLDQVELGESIDTQFPVTFGISAMDQGDDNSDVPAATRIADASPATAGIITPRLSLKPEPTDGETVLVDELDELMERIQRALEGEGFTLALQPIVSLMGDSREHYSVLVRLRRPDGTLASAAQIIRSAADTGRVADIDRWVIRSALRLLGQRRRGGDKAAFFISLSPDLVADEQLLIWICDTLRELDVRSS